MMHQQQKHLGPAPVAFGKLYILCTMHVASIFSFVLYYELPDRDAESIQSSQPAKMLFLSHLLIDLTS